MSNFLDRFNPQSQTSVTEKTSPIANITNRIRQSLGLGPTLQERAQQRDKVFEQEKKQDKGFEDRFAPMSRQEKENYESMSIDLMPDDKGIKITSPNMPEVVIKKEDLTEEQRAAYDDMKMAKEIEDSARNFRIFQRVEDIRNEKESPRQLLEQDTVTDKETIPIYGALDILGRGISGIFNINRATEQQEEAQERRSRTETYIVEKIEEARKEGDGERVKNLISALQTTGGITDTVSENLQREIDAAPTDQQIIGASAELAILATMGGIRGGTSFVKGVAPRVATKSPVAARASAKLLHTAKRYGLSAINSGSRIGLWSAAGEMKIEDADVDDIIAAGERGFKTGLFLGPAITATGDLIGYGLKSAVGPTRKFVNSSVKKLEKVAQGKETMPITPLEKALQGIEKPLTAKQKAAKLALSTVDSVKKIEQRLVDRFSPIRRIENRIHTLKGRPLEEKEKVYRDIRMLQAWADGKTDVKVSSFANKLNKFSPETQQTAKGYLNLLDSIDRAQRGLAVPGGKKLPQLKKELAQLIRFTGKDEMKNVAEIRRIVNNYTKHELMGDYRAGLITKQEMKRMLEAHKNYMPHDVVMSKTDTYVGSMGQSMDVSKTTLNRAIGSTREIKDPFEAIINRSLIGERVRQKNILMRNLFDAQKKHNVISGASKIKEGVKPKGGFEILSYFENGKKVNYQVPTTITQAIKSTDIPIQPAWWNVITAPQRALKKGATQFNPGFVLRNKFRDTHQSALLTESFIKEAARKYGTSAKNAKNYSYKQLNEVYKRGGFGSNIFEEGEDAMRRVLQRGKVGSTFSYDNIKSINPFNAIQKTNKFVEMSTRKEAMAKALAGGLNQKDAVWISRNATVDFSRMGTWMRPVNQAIPFLNARVQGLTNLPKAFLANPDRFSEAIMNTAVLPTMLLHQHNRRYESYKYINQGIKDLDWVIMTGEVPSVNPYNGEEILVPQFITIKRGEGQNLVSAPIRHWLEKEDEIDHRNVSQMMADMFGSNSPVDFGTYSRQNFAGSLISQFGPLASGVVGSFSNKHPYFGTDIVPEYRTNLHQEMQFSARTPEFLKQAVPKELYRSGFAETFNISPAMVDFYISVFGGMPQDIMRAVDIAYGVKRDGKMGGLNVTDTTFETLSELPIIRGFLKQSLNNTTEADRILVSDVERDIATDDRMIKDRADEIIAELRTIKEPQKRRDYWNLLGDEVTPELILEVLKRGESRQTIDGLRAIDRVDVRAEVIRIKLEDMREKGYTKEMVQEYIQDLTEANILNESVLNEMLRGL